MAKARLTLAAMVAALGIAAAPALADSKERSATSEPIAGKAAEKRAAPAKQTPQRKRYEFTGAAVAAPAAAKATVPQDSPGTEPAMKDKSHCHSRGSDA